MKHISFPVENSIEFINISEVSPLISKCQIKVCYVGEQPNRNTTVITKEFAKEMAKGLPGSPIVGRFNEQTGDFEEHNKEVLIKDGKFAIVDTTKPYGFVAPDAKNWFQKFIDDGEGEREYLVTVGYIWTTANPESQRIFSEDGYNQSMELHKDSVKGYWAGNMNSDNRFFIFNEAIIEKLCILGEDYEPCFEGSQIKAQFSLEEEFSQLKNTLYSMMDELKEALNKGGSETFMSQELNTPVIEEQENVIVVEENPTGEFVKDDEKEKKKKEESKDNSNEEKSKESEDKSEGEKPEDKKEDEEDKKSKYILEEVVEYTELKAEYDALVEKYSALEQENANLQAEVQPFKEFKLEAEKQSKMEMINSFYMLSDEDKKDVLDNINEYSLDDIEAKLAVICVRNKVSFSLEEEKETPAEEQMMFNLNDSTVQDSTPEWLKAVKQVASEM